MATSQIRPSNGNCRPQMNKIVLRLPQTMLLSLKEMCVLATMPLESFLAELIEAQIASFRCARIPPDFLVPKNGDPRGAAAINRNDVHRQYDDELRNRVLLRLARHDKVSQISESTGVSKNTIRRWKREDERDA